MPLPTVTLFLYDGMSLRVISSVSVMPYASVMNVVHNRGYVNVSQGILGPSHGPTDISWTLGLVILLMNCYYRIPHPCVIVIPDSRIGGGEKNNGFRVDAPAR